MKFYGFENDDDECDEHMKKMKIFFSGFFNEKIIEK